MKFAVIADIHLSKYGQDKIEDESNLPERLHSIKTCLYEVAEFCKQNEIKTLVMAGDVLHGKSVIYAIAENIMLDFFKDFGKDIQFYVIDGNHDLSGKGEDVVSGLRSLEHVPGVNWINFNSQYTLTTLKGDKIAFIPYSYNMVEKIKNTKAKILISHFGLSEGQLNSGMSIVSDLAIKDLDKNYELVILGHYHKPQEIQKAGFRLFYTGSLVELDWGEKNEQKRFLVVDTDTMVVDSIPINSYRKHIEIKINKENKTEALKLAKISKDAGDHVKIIMDEMVDLKDVENDFNIVDKTQKDITDRGISSSMSTVDKLARFLEIKQIPEEMKVYYMDAAMQIINKCEANNATL